MKRFLLYLFLLSPVVLFAQTKKKTKKVYSKPSFSEYYALHYLTPDSAKNLYLYYQVYEWIGTRYHYAGETKKGIDCSGFVSKMYSSVYCTTLSGGSADIYKNLTPLEKHELKEGDMVFFKIKKGRISHVGIYLGNNKFAHATVHSGVIISDLNEEYYKKYFYKGGRLKI